MAFGQSTFKGVCSICKTPLSKDDDSNGIMLAAEFNEGMTCRLPKCIKEARMLSSVAMHSDLRKITSKLPSGSKGQKFATNLEPHIVIIGDCHGAKSVMESVVAEVVDILESIHKAYAKKKELIELIRGFCSRFVEFAKAFLPEGHLGRLEAMASV